MEAATFLVGEKVSIWFGAAEWRRIVQAARKPPEPADDGAAEIVYP